MHQWHWFQFVAYGILTLFLGIMALVTIQAYQRHSGSTGIDVSKIQQVRYKSVTNK